MATLSLRIREDLKRKAQELARREGVSLNNCITTQHSPRQLHKPRPSAYFEDRLKGIHLTALQERVPGFMRQTQRGEDPCLEDLQDAKGKRF